MEKTLPQHSHSERPGGPLLRDALRILRHVAREGRDIVQQSTSKAGKPVEHLAETAIAGVDRIAHGAEEVAHLMLGENSIVALPATALQANTLNASAFAHATYAALGHILRNLGAQNWLISEIKLARAFESAKGASDVERATALIISTQNHAVIVEARMDPDSQLGGRDAAQLAYFALMLWMLTEKSSDDAQEVLDSATALSLALRNDILKVQGNRTAIAALLKEFRDHV